MKIKYTPEIDGLRAIAVISVIIYHAEIYSYKFFHFQIFSGGFLGVDIFFVISGYLITSIILKEINQTKSFNLNYFYQRRIRRIIPALLFVIILTIPLSWFFLDPRTMLDFSKSALSALFFGANYFFYISEVQYEVLDSLEVPLLHLWSLSVEEQFYIFFSVFIIFIYKFFKNKILFILIIFFLISLFLSNLTTKYNPALSFYFTHTRIWELIAGAILAQAKISNLSENNNRFMNEIMPLLGIIFISFSIFFLGKNTPHPSFFTLITVAGTCLLIWYSNSHSLVNKVLKSKIFVGTGLLSYSLYLWHFPIFAFARITEFASGNFLYKIYIALIVLILSLITYFFIEKPSRNLKINFKKILGIILFSYLSVIIFVFLSLKSNGFYKRLPPIMINNLFERPYHLLINFNKDGEGNFCHNNPSGCIFNPGLNKTVYMIGDSHAGSLTYDLRKKLKNTNFTFKTYTLAHCILFPGYDLVHIHSKAKQKCNNEYFLKLIRELKSKQDSVVIISGRYALYLNNEYFDNKQGGKSGVGSWSYRYQLSSENIDFESSFIKAINDISKNNKVILIYPIPEVGWDVPKKIFFNRIKKMDLTTDYNLFLKRNKSSFNMLDKVSGRNIFRVYPHKIVCNRNDNKRCISYDDNYVYYSDDNHPSILYSEKINTEVMRVLNNLEK